MIGFGYIFKKFKTFLEINKNIQINISVLTLKFFDIVDIKVEDGTATQITYFRN